MGFVHVTAIGTATTVNPNLGSIFENQIELLLNKYASDANDLLLQPTESWENHTVVFSRELRKESNRIYNVVYTSNEVYFWLNYGTSVRRAKLSKDWRSKTRVRELKAGGGSGRVERIDKRFAFPGIEARGWTDVVAEQMQPQFTLDMQRLAFEAAGIRTR